MLSVNQMRLFGAEETFTPILMSLKQQWLERIVGGTKKHEFRRIFPREKTCAFIYIISPGSILSHVMWLDAPIVGPPAMIAAIGERERAGGGSSVLAYLG